MRISDWSSDVFSSDLHILDNSCAKAVIVSTAKLARTLMPAVMRSEAHIVITMENLRVGQQGEVSVHDWAPLVEGGEAYLRSEEHTSELQSLMRISYAVFCLKKKNILSPNVNQHISRPLILSTLYRPTH